MDGSVAVVIVNYRTAEMAIACVAALAPERANVPGLRVVVVDGGSGDGSGDILRAGLARYDWVKLLCCDFNGGFGWANNQGMLHLLQQRSPPAYIHLLNPDTIVAPGAVAALRADLLANPKSAAAGSQLVEPDGGETASAFRFPTIAREFFRGAQMNRVGHALGLSEGIMRPASARVVEWVTGASVMLRAEALRHVGLFDTGFFLYFEEVELMHRLTRAGWQIRFVPESRVMHVGGAATGMADAEMHERSSIPDYIFQSRRRFFSLTRGPAVARNASRAWRAGNDVLRTVQRLGFLRDRRTADAERAGMDRHGLVADDVPRAITRWDDPPGARPAWHRLQ